MDLAGRFRFSNSIVVVMRVDDGAFVDVNPAFERVTGWSRAEAIGQMPITLGIWQDHEVRALIWSRLRTRQHLAAERITFQDRHGRAHHALLSCEMFEQGGETHVISILQAIGDGPTPRTDGTPAEPVESYRSLFQSAAEGIYRSLPDGGFIDVNPAMARIFGFASAADMITSVRGDAASLYADASHGAWLRAELDARGRLQEVRSRVRRKDGSIIWISENARTVCDPAGHTLFYEGTVIDITDRLAADAALRQSEALYKILIDNCRDGVFLIQRGKIVFANQALARMLGYDELELRGKQYFDLIAPKDREAQLQRRVAREAGSTTAQDYEVSLLRRDGTRTLFAVHADAVTYNGDIASTGVARDITEERARQQALEEAERKFRELFEHSPVGLFRTHPDGRVLEVNQSMAEMVGYRDPAHLKASVVDLASLYVDPFDRERWIAELRVSHRLRNLRAHIRRADGTPIWVDLSVEMRERDGHILFEGSLQDITQRVATEKALKRSEARYRNLIDHSQVGVYLMQGDHYAYVNVAFAQMVGRPEAEVTGMSYRDLLTAESLALVDDRIARRARGEAIPTEYEVELRRADGAIVHATVSAGFLDVDGEQLIGGTMRDITRHRQAEQRLKFHATHDALTGMPNRLLFQQRLQESMRASRQGGGYPYAVLYLDLDGFKLVNDSLGHAAGDRLLVTIAEKLTQTLNGDALIARYGGDEFTVLPLRPCDRERAIGMAEKVLRLFTESFDIGGHRVFSGASVGIVLGRPEYRSPDHVLRDADTAMYRAKAAGKSGYVVFDETMHREARARFQLETDLRLALSRDEFVVHYQPIVALDGGRIVGCEALVRWRHPSRGLLYPPDFLHVAEEAGLIAELDWWVLEQTCTQLAGWQRRYPAYELLRANVNVDERQFNDKGLVAGIAAVLGRTGLAPRSLSLEVTETVFRGGRGQAGQTLAALKAIGVSLVVDDFGTGYSSLDSFASSPFDALKVDRSFVHDMETNRRHRAIVRTITGFAEDLGLELTAEGVETAAQAALLRELGCVTAQGFLYSPAIPAAEFEALLEGQRELARVG